MVKSNENFEGNTYLFHNFSALGHNRLLNQSIF
jgi:hypothetical protein